MIEVDHVSFAYSGGGRVLDDVSLHVAPGERVVLLGANGSGKSTLARLVNGGLVPASGTVRVDGVVSGLARLVGYVRQDPRNQLVSALVSDEVAFGPRNLGLSRAEVLGRVDEALGVCGISQLHDRLTSELSGGQQQLVALAGVLAMRPRYIVLDEVGSHLDEASRVLVSGLVAHLVGAGVGVLEIAHDPLSLFGATRAVVMGAGRVAWEGRPQELLASDEACALAGLDEDSVARVLGTAVRRGFSLGSRSDPRSLAPFLTHEDVCYLGQYLITSHFRPFSTSKVALVRCSQFCLKDISLDLGGLTLVLGPSGAGKTTLARILAGVMVPDAGEVLLDGRPVRAGRVGLAFQRPGDQLFCDTVYDDIAYGPRARGMSEGEVAAAARSTALRLGVGEELFDRSPFGLSGGQMRRVALAGVIAGEPEAYVFDEPTAGLDAASRAELHRLVRGLVGEGHPVVLITHDADEWLDEATSVAFLREGRLVAHVGADEAGARPELFAAAGLEVPFMVRLRAELGGGVQHG